MRLRRLVAVVFAAMPLVLAAAATTLPRGPLAEAANTTVDVGSNWFCNPSFTNGVCDTTINRGDSVIWNWVGGLHNVTECGVNWSKETSCTGPDWGSGTRSSGTFSLTFNVAGTNYYRCTVHAAAMRGRIIVNDPDADSDGWSNYLETLIGTDPAARCPTSSTHNAWPADLNNDGFSDITDVAALTGNFGAASPPAPARQNIAPDPPDSFVDITDIARLTGLFGKSCSGP